MRVSPGRARHAMGLVLTLVAAVAPHAQGDGSPDMVIAIACTAIALAAFLAPVLGWWAAILTAPASAHLSAGIAGAEVAFPVEPILAGLTVAWLVHRPRDTIHRFRSSPLVLASVAVLIWTVFSAATSLTPLASAKLVLLRTVSVVGVLGWGLQILMDPDSRRRLPLAAAASLVPVLVWALARRLFAGIDMYAAPQPFFPNRLEFTILAAVWFVAILHAPAPRPRRLVWVAVPVVVIVTMPSRTALLAVAAACLVAAGIRAANHHPGLLAAGGVAVAITAALAVDFGLWWNAPARSRPTPLGGLWRTVAANPPLTDPSVLERLNRWRAAWVMAARRPVAGFGPGSYESHYGAYQRERDATRWTTSRGDLGDAHSEVAARLAEEGVPGAALWLLWIGTLVVYAGCRGVSPEWSGAAAAIGVASLFAGLSDIPALSIALLAITALVAVSRSRFGDHRHDPSRDETGIIQG